MDTTCSICLDDEYDSELGFENSKYTTECNHHFHHGCISRWYRSSSLCPNCRTQPKCCVPVSQTSISTQYSIYNFNTNNIYNHNNYINNIINYDSNNINYIINNID